MQTKFIIIAAASALAAPAIAATYDAPYALSAVHADLQAQLETAAAAPAEVGAAARVAADLMASQNAAQEWLVLPLLGWTDAAGATAAGIDLIGQAQTLEAEMTWLFEGDVALVTALAELFAAAEEAGQSETALMAERMIWHETSDVEVLYPAALLVGATQAQAIAQPVEFPATAGPLYGSEPFPMMGVGNPHPPAKAN